MAIEPVPETYRILCRNIELNGLCPKVEIYQVGVGSHPGTQFFTTNRGTMNRVATEEDLMPKLSEPKVVPVSIDTLDNLVGDRSCTVLKIDVEGFEENVLLGAKHVLSQESLTAIIIELYNPHLAHVLRSHCILESYGFYPVSYDPFKRNLTPLQTFRTDQFNTVYVRNQHAVEERLKKGPRFHVFGIDL